MDCSSKAGRCTSHLRHGDTEAIREPLSRHFPPGGDLPNSSPRRFEDHCGCRIRCAAVEWRLGRVLHVKLDRARGIVTAQFSRDPQRAVDTGSHAGGEDHVPVNDHTLIDGNGAEERQKVKRRPMRAPGQQRRR